MQEEGVDGAIDPEHLQTAAGKSAALDFGSIGKGNDRAAGELANDLLALQVVAEGAEIDGDKIVGHAEDRRLIDAAAGFRPAQFGFVVAGEQPLGIAVVGCQRRGKVLLEEQTGGIRLT